MDKLPYFIALVKKNVILYSIITAGSFTVNDFKGYNTSVWSDAVIDVENFQLSEDDQFKFVRIMKGEIGTYITFYSNSSKYFDNPKKYFDRDSPVRERNYEMFAKQVSSNSKRLGEFDHFGVPMDVTLYNSSVYGYTVSLFFKNEKYFERQ